MNFNPMLSADARNMPLEKLRYPLMVSPKLDGIRCLVWDGKAYSRNAKLIRSPQVQEWAANHHGLDGELICGSPTDPHCMYNTQSGVMSFAGTDDFKYHLFDITREGAVKQPFHMRHASGLCVEDDKISHVPHEWVYSQAELLAWDEHWLMQGYEGIMLRDPQGKYKYGRSTLREGALMKLKRFQDGEAVVLRVEEGWANCNPLQKDELGRAKRSKGRAGLVPSGMVGTIIARSEEWGELRIAPSKMPYAERVAYWRLRDSSRGLTGKTIHWRCFGYGVKDAPRFARFYGIREDL